MSEAESFATASAADDFVYLAAFQQLVLERTHDLITVLDPSGAVVYASPSWLALAGWDPDSLVGTAFLELTDPDDPELAAGIAEVLAGATIEAVTG
jgi:PAS domain S-box-containing protein